DRPRSKDDTRRHTALRLEHELVQSRVEVSEWDSNLLRGDVAVAGEIHDAEPMHASEEPAAADLQTRTRIRARREIEIGRDGPFRAEHDTGTRRDDQKARVDPSESVRDEARVDEGGEAELPRHVDLVTGIPGNHRVAE